MKNFLKIGFFWFINIYLTESYSQNEPEVLIQVNKVCKFRVFFSSGVGAVEWGSRSRRSVSIKTEQRRRRRINRRQPSGKTQIIFHLKDLLFLYLQILACNQIVEMFIYKMLIFYKNCLWEECSFLFLNYSFILQNQSC